jgi:ribosomal-protein-alanine N-acetyltransferase
MQILSEKKIKEVFSHIPEIETERLVLRKIVPSDAEDMFEYSCNPAVTEYLTWHCHKTQKETERYINLLQKKYALGSFRDFGVEYKPDGKFIGTCGFTSFEISENSAEIGYVLSPGYWGKEIAVEAARAVMKFGFAVFDLDKIIARHIDGNNTSARVMQKLGMSHATTYKNSFYIKNRYVTVHEYAVTKREFFEALQNIK